MIRLCKEEDREQVLNYLYDEASYNIFPIGDIEHFGFDSPFQHVYGEYDEENQIVSIFLQYREHAIYYAKDDIFNPEYVPLLEEYAINYISGKSNLMDLCKPYLPQFESKRMYFCSANTPINQEELDFSMVSELKTREDCEKIYELLVLITEFGIHKQTKEHFVDAKMHGLEMGVTVYIEVDGNIVATASTTAETTKNAMVIAVATHPDYREKGYASLLMQYLIKLYVNDHQKELCLFYNNPKAGAIYLRLGFEYIGTWDMFERVI